MKFTQIIGAREIPPHIKDCLKEQPARSGSYNWIFAFKGEINTWWEIKDRLHEFDVVQVNMSPKDWQTVINVREELTRTKNTHTKLVINNDYVCECWTRWDVNPYLYDSIQRMGDMVFGTEPYQVSNMVDGAFCIPHPTNIKWLKRLGSDYKFNSVGYIFHWWEGGTYLPHRTLEKVKAKYNIKQSKIYGYNGKYDKMSSNAEMMWDVIEPLNNFEDYAEKVQGEKCVYDPNPYHTYGRNGVELACWGVPIVGSDRVYSYKKLFPELCCDPYDFNATMEKFDIIFNQPEKLKEIMDKAYEKVEYFNYENSKNRYMEALKIAVDRGGYKWYQQNG